MPCNTSSCRLDVDFWRENSYCFNLDKNAARFARNVVQSVNVGQNEKATKIDLVKGCVSHPDFFAITKHFSFLL